MQFSAVEIRFIVTTLLYSTFANDLKRKFFFSKNVHSYRVCSFKKYHVHFRISYTMNAEGIFRSSIGCEIMLMIKARIRLIFSMYIYIHVFIS